ncbi:MAG: hypothetical protein GWN77_06650 [Gammaproteobacteria bacterium]|nr:hypothetical protein [Phycisphaerae bacterium]NIR26630.1 hypothetical protein [Gammaproteobacteria bacterium]NIS54348.1 hypothetical protein [Phycisphaerae bacterium]NIX02159.1 hypothetical protein [Phycisphaerae bacterium]
METKKKKTVSNRAVRYPLIVLGVGILLAVVGSKLTGTNDLYSFGRAFGRITVFAFIVALVVGYMSDRKRRTKEQKISQPGDQ